MRVLGIPRGPPERAPFLALEPSELEKGSLRRSRGRSRVSEDPLGARFGAPGDRKSRFGELICVPEAAIRCENASDLSAAKVRSLATPLRARKTRFSRFESHEKRSSVCRTYSNFALRFVAKTLHSLAVTLRVRNTRFSLFESHENEAACSEHIRPSSRSLFRGRRTWPQAT